MKKDLLELIYQSDFVKALKGKGKNFHVDDYAGICLTFASLFNKNKGKYSVELHCNSIGTEEYNFIRDYFNSTDNQNNIT